MAPRVIRAASMASSHSNGTAVKSPPPTRGMWANGSRLSSICGNPANEPSRYSAMNPTSTPYATGVNRGANPNNPTVTADNNHTAGSCTAAVPTTVGSLPPTSPTVMP